MAARRRQFVDDRDQSESGENDHHRKSTHGTGRFLQWVAEQDCDPDVTELGELYQQWSERQDNGQQTELTEAWSR